MTDHPFDEIAVEAAVKEIQRLNENLSFHALNAALTAAVKSMRDRGKARDIQDFVLIDELQPPLTCPVTIFRHGE